MPTQQEFISKLTASYNESLKFGGNVAIKRHLDKVASMTADEFQRHQAKLAAQRSSAAPTVRRLACSAMLER